MTQLAEYIKMALKNIWANKARTLLTMLGIIIGISSVILIVSVGNGAIGAISDELNGIGKGQIYFYLMDYQDKYYISKEELIEIRELEGIKAVAAQWYFEGNTQTKKDEFDVSLVGTNVDGLEFLDAEYVKGGPYTEKDAEAGKAYCIISEKDALKLFGSTNVIGMEFTVTIWDDYEMEVMVTGVTKSEESSVIEELYADPSVQVIVPPEAISAATGYDFQENIMEFSVLTEDDAEGMAVCEAVIDYLEAKHHCKDEQVYNYQSFDDQMAMINSVMSMITFFVAFVASISLVVGGIGVMNIMLVSVTERTREIGIRKALGAKTGSITIQFLAESAFITLIGGIIGIILGVAGAFVLSGLAGMLNPAMKFTPKVSVSTVLLAATFSSFVGIFFGIYPARKAAKLSPIEALRRN